MDAKSKAEWLRKHRYWSYKEISVHLGVPKSTVCYWLRDIQLTAVEQAEIGARTKELVKHAAIASNKRRKGEKRRYARRRSSATRGPSHAERARENRQHLLTKSRERVKLHGLQMTQDSLALVGAAIYWAEGEKIGSMALSNSDPALLQLYVRWLTTILRVDPRRLSFRVSAHLDCSFSHSELEEYWRTVLSMPKAVFEKPYSIPIKNKKRRKKLKHGMLRVRVSRPLRSLAKYYSVAEILGVDAESLFVNRVSPLHVLEE